MAQKLFFYAILLRMLFSQVYGYISITTNSDSQITNGQLRVDNGTSVSLVCTVNTPAAIGPGGPFWNGPKQGLAFGPLVLHGDRARYSVTEEETTGGKTQFILEMRNLNLADEGKYSCQNLFSHEKEFVTIFVTTAPDIYDITAIQTVEVGQYVVMECKASGSPAPEISWRHTRPNNRLPNGIEGEFKRGIHFNITSITLEDRGEYECIARNGVPNDESQQNRTTFIRMKYKPVVKAITDDAPEVKIPVGDPASLTCKSMAFPRPSTADVIWYLEEFQINNVDGYQVDVVHQLPSETVDPYKETTYSTLFILEVNSNTTGNYTCQFANERGVSVATISLQNKMTTKPPAITHNTANNKMTTQPPAITHNTANIITFLSGVTSRQFAMTTEGVTSEFNGVLTTVRVETNEIEINWEPFRSTNDYISQYRVFYQVRDNNTDSSVIFVEGNQTSIVITNLLHGTLYRIWVEAYTQEAILVDLGTIDITTPDVPDATTSTNLFLIVGISVGVLLAAIAIALLIFAAKRRCSSVPQQQLDDNAMVTPKSGYLKLDKP
ncbi:uncharacterized protein [Amphiura filiformis]|uniref:uncharacterized protein isoform X2 n=1 Tax=Amphiura filiformis TaxID=82378 RepID=UPI003B21AC3C